MGLGLEAVAYTADLSHPQLLEGSAHYTVEDYVNHCSAFCPESSWSWLCN